MGEGVYQLLLIPHDIPKTIRKRKYYYNEPTSAFLTLSIENGNKFQFGWFKVESSLSELTSVIECLVLKYSVFVVKRLKGGAGAIVFVPECLGLSSERSTIMWIAKPQICIFIYLLFDL